MSAVLEPPTVILSRKLAKQCLIQIGLKSQSKPWKHKFTKANETFPNRPRVV